MSRKMSSIPSEGNFKLQSLNKIVICDLPRRKFALKIVRRIIEDFRWPVIIIMAEDSGYLQSDVNSA